MDLDSRLAILSDGAKYDVSCSSSGSNRRHPGKGLGASAPSGICHSWSDDGRCISLLKILYTNDCIYNCQYCVYRCTNDQTRASFTPEEVARLTVEFYRRNYIEGLFLSSGIRDNPDRTMEELVQTVWLLRKKHQFHGYIHLKGIPGADLSLIGRAGSLVDRLSVNIELPTVQSLKLLAPQKKPEKLVRPMAFMHRTLTERTDGGLRRSKDFLPAGQTTQMIIGATPDTDQDIIMSSARLYQTYGMKRVYYSAYIPANSDDDLPKAQPPLLREHRLYQADWLMRFYSFDPEEILGQRSHLDLQLDPKIIWALDNVSQFPVEVNRASYHELLRVPGIGPTSATRIVRARRCGRLHFEDLKALGVVVRRARFFVTASGKYFGLRYNDSATLRSYLTEGRAADAQQLTLFDFIR